MNTSIAEVTADFQAIHMMCGLELRSSAVIVFNGNTCQINRSLAHRVQITVEREMGRMTLITKVAIAVLANINSRTETMEGMIGMIGIVHLMGLAHSTRQTTIKDIRVSLAR
jgi:hypothetical protein